MSRVSSAKAIFEQNIQQNLEHAPTGGSKDFLSVVGKSQRPRNLFATPRPRRQNTSLLNSVLGLGSLPSMAPLDSDTMEKKKESMHSLPSTTTTAAESVSATSVDTRSKHLLKPPYTHSRSMSPTSSSVNSAVSRSSCESLRSQVTATGTTTHKNMLLVAPSPSKLEQHAVVRNSVLQSLRHAPLTEEDSVEFLLQSPMSTQSSTKKVVATPVVHTRAPPCTAPETRELPEESSPTVNDSQAYYGYGDQSQSSPLIRSKKVGASPRVRRQSMSSAGSPKNHGTSSPPGNPSSPSTRSLHRHKSMTTSPMPSLSPRSPRRGSASPVSNTSVGAMTKLFESQSFLRSPRIQKRVCPLDLNMKKTEIVARRMARRRGTLMHQIIGQPQRDQLLDHIKNRIKWSLEEHLQKNRRTTAEQQKLDAKASVLFPTRGKPKRRHSVKAHGCRTILANNTNTARRKSLSHVQEASQIRHEFLQAHWSLGEKIWNKAATVIQARMRTFRQQSYYRITRLNIQLAGIEKAKIIELDQIRKKTRQRNKVFRKKYAKSLQELAVQAAKAEKLKEHLKRENVNIRDQNARLQEVCFRLQEINRRLERTNQKHMHNCNAMSKFVVKVELKKRRIEAKMKQYEAQIDLLKRNMEIVQSQTELEKNDKARIAQTLHSIASTVAAKSSNARLKELLKLAAAGKSFDDLAVNQLVPEELETNDTDLGSTVSEEGRQVEATLENVPDEKVVDDALRTDIENVPKEGGANVFDDDENDSDDESFLLTFTMDDHSDISDVSSVESNVQQVHGMHESITECGYVTEQGRKGSDSVSMYTEVVVEDETDSQINDERWVDSQGLEFEGVVYEEIIEEEVVEEEGSIIEIVVSSDEDSGDQEDASDDDFSDDSSVYVDRGSIIM